jgi:hypothetical protein
MLAPVGLCGFVALNQLWHVEGLIRFSGLWWAKTRLRWEDKMTVESYKGYQIGSVARGGNFQISKNGTHMAKGNSLVDARLMIDFHENYLISQEQLPLLKKVLIAASSAPKD